MGKMRRWKRRRKRRITTTRRKTKEFSAEIHEKQVAGKLQEDKKEVIDKTPEHLEKMRSKLMMLAKLRKEYNTKYSGNNKY
jgi:hypothetical protein